MIVFFLITASNPLQYASARNTGLILEFRDRLEISIEFSAEKDGVLAEKQPITNHLICGLSVDWLNWTSNRLIGTQTNQSSWKGAVDTIDCLQDNKRRNCLSFIVRSRFSLKLQLCSQMANYIKLYKVILDYNGIN